MKTLLRVDGLSAGYGKKIVLNDISFEVRTGEKLCVLGCNGCGKSTLLKALCGILDYSGDVLLDGENLKALRACERAQRVGLLNQFSQAPFGFTVAECVETGTYARRKKGVNAAFDNGISPAAIDAMRFAEVIDLSDRYLNELSGGQLQRVFLARAFAQDPNILLLDEPANHLDISSQRSLVLKLNEWVSQKDRCVVCVFHDISLALDFADRVLILQHGKILQHVNVDGLDYQKLSQAYGTDVKGYMYSLCQRWAKAGDDN